MDHVVILLGASLKWNSQDPPSSPQVHLILEPLHVHHVCLKYLRCKIKSIYDVTRAFVSFLLSFSFS